MKKTGCFPRLWRFIKRLFLILFIFQFVYIILLKWLNPPITITQLSSLLTGHGLKRDYVNKKEMSVNAKLAVIASEDQLFPDHNGFDFKSIEKAMKHNQKSKSMHGASTISQQVAKNVFLWQGRSWIRKAMEVYFNVSEMGKGVYGIEAAAHFYYNHAAKTLSRGEAAKIAACLPNPKVF